MTLGGALESEPLRGGGLPPIDCPHPPAEIARDARTTFPAPRTSTQREEGQLVTRGLIRGWVRYSTISWPWGTGIVNRVIGSVSGARRSSFLFSCWRLIEKLDQTTGRHFPSPALGLHGVTGGFRNFLGHQWAHKPFRHIGLESGEHVGVLVGEVDQHLDLVRNHLFEVLFEDLATDPPALEPLGHHEHGVPPQMVLLVPLK